MRNHAKRGLATLAACMLGLAIGCTEDRSAPREHEPAFGESGQNTPIETAVERKISRDKEFAPEAIVVDAEEGVVTLRGEVENAKQKGKAEELAKEVPGVERVENQIVIAMGR